MKNKNGILATAGTVLCFASLLFAAPRADFAVTKTYRNEGNTVAPFTLSCSSTAWTAVVAARAVRRSGLMQSLKANAYNVCIATTSASGDLCNDATPGIELAPGDSLTDFAEVAWNCRARTGSSGERIKGYESYDSAD